MTLAPLNTDELSRALASANERNEKIEAISLRALNRVLEYTPEDMTVTVEAGILLADLQAQLSKFSQWMPMDPPHPEQTAIGAILDADSSGPRRLGYGAIREHLLGLRVALADGRVIKAGGRVVKNVAGYDLCKLFVGARGSLGVIVEATFKLKPLPEAEKFVQAHFDTLEKAGSFLSGVLRSEVAPVALDLHHQVSGGLEPPSAFTVVAGFAGMKEDVAWQISRMRDLGASDSSSLEYERRFWNAPLASVRRLSAIPSKIAGSLARLKEAPFVARAGNGVIYYRGGPEPPKTDPPGQLARRIKDAYDPKHILSDIPI